MTFGLGNSPFAAEDLDDEFEKNTHAVEGHQE